MFLALLGCGIALLAVFLGMLHIPPKPIRIWISIMATICIALLVLAIITENPFDGKKSKPQSAEHEVIITDYTDSKENINKLFETLNELEIEELHIITNSWRMDMYARK